MQNLRLLQRRFPKLTLRILHCEIEEKEQNETLEEAQKRVQQIELNTISTLFQIGVGKGYVYRYLEPWLKTNLKHALYFVEDSLEAILSMIKQPHAEEMLKNPAVKFIYINGSLSNKGSFEYFPKFIDYSDIGIVSIQAYQKERNPFVEQVTIALNREVLKWKVFISEYLQLSKQFFQNFYQNLKLIDTFVEGKTLYNSFLNRPVILCGAGPSLMKQIPLLKKLKEKAFIVAGGGAMGALSNAGIIPHLSVAIDPSCDERQRMWDSNGFETPVLFRLRINFEALRLTQGMRLFYNGSSNYHTSQWLEEKMSIPLDQIEEGVSCITFALSLLSALGLSPIFLVGVDLAFTDEQAYSPGVKHAACQESIGNGFEWESEVTTQDLYGNPIRTKQKWLSESAWISAFAVNRHIINATEGGIGFKGVLNRPLEEFFHFHPQRDLSNELHVKVHECKKVKVNDINEIILDIENSFKRALTHVESILDHLYEKYDAFLIDKKIDVFNMETLAEVACFQGEIAYTYFFRTLDYLLKKINSDWTSIERSNKTQSKNLICLLLREINRYQVLQESVFFHLENIELIKTY